MKKFLIKVFILFIIQVTVIGIIILIPLPENSYDLAIINKHRILACTKSPKIVIAGGSNLAFGIDSAEIQNELNIPVVNMGLYALFGLGRILDDISPFLNSGDILLVIPEYAYFTDFYNGIGAAYELIFDVRQFRLLYSSYSGLPSGFSDYLATHLSCIIHKTINTSNPFAYSRDGFNEYGDYIKHLDKENMPFVSLTDIGTLNIKYLKYFFQFVDDLSARGITVLLSYPSYEEQSFCNSTECIHKLDKALRTNKNLLVISTPDSFCFPADYFYDTFYHLNKEGRAVRTGKLIQDLQASGIFNKYPSRWSAAK